MPGIQITDDTITFSQSWTNTFMLCPEQARLEMVGELPKTETDATAIGTAAHAGFEAVILGASLTEGEAVAIETFHERTQDPTFQFASYKTLDGAAEALQRVYWEWANEVWPQLPGHLAVEWKFDLRVGHTVAGRNIHISGAIDYIDEFGGIWDWKTANGFRSWEQWQVDRFKIQPTFYAYALWMSDQGTQLGDQLDFTYCVMNKQRSEHRMFTTTRGPQHFNWLVEQLETICKMVEAPDLDVWPKNDQHALCSKWCTAYDKCKGRHVPLR